MPNEPVLLKKKKKGKKAFLILGVRWDAPQLSGCAKFFIDVKNLFFINRNSL